MREKVSADRLTQFMKFIGRGEKKKTKVYFVGGATAVLLGWRETTIDIDLKIVPELDEILRKLPKLKEDLQLNIELASPDDFVPALPGWEERSSYIGREGGIEFFHYDFYGQALAKIERGHSTDLKDVREMIDRGLVEPARLLELFSRVEDKLYKYPAIDAKSLRQAVEQVAKEQ
ncbi:MAG TPA: DUF6036 family nucleotidyltransferase [Pyrinomonadaceae bacterium]|nr:DUF6036 family nucleotidyltransferase [Pyrinomonadaceae bacterium]